MAASLGDWAMYVVVGGTLGAMAIGTALAFGRALIQGIRNLFRDED